VQLHFPLVKRRDPWWDLEGKGARRLRTRRRIESAVAFVLAIGAASFVTALWLETLFSLAPA
jgi:hypothetical protein